MSHGAWKLFIGRYRSIVISKVGIGGNSIMLLTLSLHQPTLQVLPRFVKWNHFKAKNCVFFQLTTRNGPWKNNSSLIHRTGTRQFG
jgi:hypothetical protein